MADGNINNNKKTNADQVNIPNTPSVPNPQDSKAKKVLLAELQELMEVLVAAENGTPSQEANFKQVVQKIVNGSTGVSSADVLKAMTGTFKKDGGNLGELLKLISASMKDIPEVQKALGHMQTAQDLTKELERAIKEGETSLDEVLGEENFQAFLGALAPQKKGETFGGTSLATSRGAASTGGASGIDVSHKEVLMEVAVALQKLLSTVFNNQTDQGNMYADALKTQLSVIEQTAKDRIAEINKEQQQASQTQKKPWYMYLIGAVVAAVGAVITFFTAGAAAAVVGLAVAAIMLSPIGDDITKGHTKAFLGDNANPTDAQKTGAQIGATAVIAVITALLSMGAGGITTGADAAADGAADGIADAAEASSSVSSSFVEDSEGLAMEMNEIGGGAGSGIESPMEEEAASLEGELEDELADAGDARSSSDSDSSSTSRGGRRFKVGWDTKAFAKGFAKRLMGNVIAGFAGSGGILELADLVCDSNPDWKKWAQSETGSIVLAVVGVIASIGVGLGSSKLLVEPGATERADYLEFVGKQDFAPTLSKTARTILDLISISAQAGNAAAGYVKMKQYFNLESTKELLAYIDAALVTQTASVKTMNTTQDAMNKGYATTEQTLTESLKQIFDTLGNDQRGTANGM